MSDTAFELIVLLGWPIPVVGALLLFRGIRGRRIGNEPRCRKCKYILIGISSSRCPECGRDVTAKGRQAGLWRLRRLSFVAGLCLALISLAVVEQYVYPRVYSYVNGVDWYRYYPTDWLLSLIDRDTDGIGKELVDRLDRGLLSEEQRQQFIELLITKYRVAVYSNSLWYLAEVLDTLYGQNQLSDEQVNRFSSQLISMRFAFRSVVRQGDPLVLFIDPSSIIPYKWRCIHTGKATTMRFGSPGENGIEWYASVPIDWDLFRRETPSCGVGWYFEPEYYAYSIEDSQHTAQLRPGIQHVQLVGKQYIRKGRRYSTVGDVVWSSPFALTTKIEVLAADAPDPVEWIEPSAMGMDLQSIYGVKQFEGRVVRARRSGKSFFKVDPHYSGGFRCKRLPCMVAFEVFAKVGDQEFRAGELIEKPIGYTDMVSHKVPTLGQDHFTLILRSSRDLARRTYGVDAIWHGEITLGPIPIVLHKTKE